MTITDAPPSKGKTPAKTTTANPRPVYRTLVGNLTRDPLLRFSPKGAAWTTTGLAVNRHTKDEDGKYVELEPDFYDLVCFGSLAEHVAESLVKGDRVVAFGKLEESTWTGRDGTERTSPKLVVDDMGPSLRFGTCQVDRLAHTGPAYGSERDVRATDATTPDELFGPPDE